VSGNVVAWVFAHFPITTEGESASSARSRKLVLSEVAESANRDFENAHPGIAAICAHWGFGRSTVIRHLNWLVEDGWLEVTEPGVGRGNATIYRVCRERAGKVPERDRLAEEKVPKPDAKRSHSGEEKVPNSQPAPITHPGSDSPLENTPAVPLTMDVEILDGTDPVQRVFAAWLESTGKTSRTVLDADRRKVILKALALGFTVEDLVAAVRGWRHSPHHRGENERKTVYNRLGLLLRDAEQIEMFRDLELRDARLRPKVADPAMEAIERMRHLEGRA